MIDLQALTLPHRFEAREFDLDADERGAVRVAVLFQEVGRGEADRVVVRVGDDRGQERGPVGVLHVD